MTPYRLVFTTCANQHDAQQLANELVTNKLAACVNLLPKIESIYMWQGKLEQGSESKLIIKTHANKVEEVMTKIKQRHSYDTPEIQVVEVTSGNTDYFNWMDEVLN